MRFNSTQITRAGERGCADATTSETVVAALLGGQWHRNMSNRTCARVFLYDCQMVTRWWTAVYRDPASGGRGVQGPKSSTGVLLQDWSAHAGSPRRPQPRTATRRAVVSARSLDCAAIHSFLSSARCLVDSSFSFSVPHEYEHPATHRTTSIP